MDLDDIRRRNLRNWIDTAPESKGNVERWCAHYSRFVGDGEKPFSPGQIRQLVPKKGKPTRNIGEDLARKLEKACGKPVGALDRDPDHTKPPIEPPALLSINTKNASDSTESSQADRWPLPEADWDRFAALPPEGKGWALARFVAGIDEAEVRYPGTANSA